MANPPLIHTQFEEAISPLLGLEISLAWKGWGSAVFLELGELTPPGETQRYQRGEITIHLGWEWRLEAEHQILLGCANSSPQIEKFFPRLKGDKIVGITMAPDVPELTIYLSSEARLKTMTTARGYPGWYIRLPDSREIRPDQGHVTLGDDRAHGMSEDESVASDRAAEAGQRWGTPVAEPMGGKCSACRSFVRLDGSFALLDYGACINAASPFDGRVVMCRSGCPAFSPA